MVFEDLEGADIDAGVWFWGLFLFCCAGCPQTNTKAKAPKPYTPNLGPLTLNPE